MKKIFTCILATLGLTSACGQQSQRTDMVGKGTYQDMSVEAFAQLVEEGRVVVLDVRTATEFNGGHLENAINIDQMKRHFLDTAREVLPTDKTIAIYCRSGRRSASAGSKLAKAGYDVVNMEGGILAWEKAGKVVTTDSYETDVFKTKSGKTLKFHALMHASIRLEYDGREIEIDPVRKLGERVTDYSRMPKADYIFVTHEHGDHFDQEAINQLTDIDTQVITNRCCSEMMGYGLVMSNGEEREIAKDIKVEAVPAYNTTEGHLQFHPKGRDNGYVLTIDGIRIYVAGDTEDVPEMASLKDIDIAFLPCNQPYTMTPEQLVRAAKMIRPKVLFPYHYGQTDVKNIPSLLENEGIEVRIRHYE